MTSKRSDPALVKKTLSGILAKYNLDKAFAKYEFVLHWPDIVGAEIAKRTKPECIRNKTLVVAVVNSAWAQELSFNKAMILQRLKGRLSDPDIITDVSFYVSKDLH